MKPSLSIKEMYPFIMRHDMCTFLLGNLEIDSRLFEQGMYRSSMIRNEKGELISFLYIKDGFELAEVELSKDNELAQDFICLTPIAKKIYDLSISDEKILLVRKDAENTDDTIQGYLGLNVVGSLFTFLNGKEISYVFLKDKQTGNLVGVIGDSINPKAKIDDKSVIAESMKLIGEIQETHNVITLAQQANQIKGRLLIGRKTIHQGDIWVIEDVIAKDLEAIIYLEAPIESNKRDRYERISFDEIEIVE